MGHHLVIIPMTIIIIMWWVKQWWYYHFFFLWNGGTIFDGFWWFIAPSYDFGDGLIMNLMNCPLTMMIDLYMAFHIYEHLYMICVLVWVCMYMLYIYILWKYMFVLRINQSVSQLYLFACVKDLKLHLAVMAFIHANLIADGGVG